MVVQHWTSGVDGGKGIVELLLGICIGHLGTGTMGALAIRTKIAHTFADVGEAKRGLF